MEPLAVVTPQEVESGVVVMADSEWESAPSNWVLNKLKGFGKLMGASYDGYEDKVIKILRDINARRLQAVHGGNRLTRS